MKDADRRTAVRAVGGLPVICLTDGVLREDVAVLRGIDGDAAARLLSAASLPRFERHPAPPGKPA